MSKKTELQNWSEIDEIEGSRCQRFEKFLKEGWQAHRFDLRAREFADGGRKEFEIKPAPHSD